MSNLRILSVCTHNRTRSVLIGALLQDHLLMRGRGVELVTGGFRAQHLPATEPTVRLLATRGIDVSEHRSRRVDDELIARADLIITAERDHVVWIAGRGHGWFQRTYTLPELVARAVDVGRRGDADLDEWLHRVGEGRPTAIHYLSAPIPEVADPTGHAPAVWEAIFREIDELCRRLAEVLT